MSEQPYRDGASIYWQAGWRGVLPLPARRKASPPIGWTGRGGGFPSAADVESWREGSEGGGNIALRLPGDVVGIDVDNYSGKLGAATMRDAIERWGPLPQTWRSTSRDDAWSGIWLYRVPTGLHWPGEIGAGVEIIQVSHRYAVVWPSIHPEDRVYRWWCGLELVAPGLVPTPVELGELPERWVAGVTGGQLDSGEPIKADLSDVEISTWLLTHGGGEQCAAVRATVDEYVRGRLRSAGSRHEAARDATARLFRMAAEGHTGVVSAVNEIGVAFRAAFGESGTRSYDASEWQRLYLGGIRLAAVDTSPKPPKDPCIVTVLDVGTISVTDAREQADQRALEAELAKERLRRRARELLDAEDADRQHRETWREPPSTFTLADELAIPDEPISWRVEQLLPRGGNAMLTASFKAGKTTLANHLTRCLVDELPFLGRFPITRLDGRVALWNYEVGRDQYRRWLREAGIEHADAVTVLNLRGFVLDVQSERAQDWIVQWLTQRDVRVWVVDPLARAFTGNENDNREVGNFLDALDVIKERAGIAELVVITHTGRMVHEIGQERARGATRIDDWPDVRWLLTKHEDGNRYFAANGRDVEIEEFELGFQQSTRQLSATGRGGRKVTATQSVRELVAGIIETNPGFTQNEIEAAAKKRREVVREAIAELLTVGRVRIEPGPNRSRKHFPAGPSILTPGVDFDDQ